MAETESALSGARGGVEFVVASYNIHRAVGGDRRKQPLRIAETIAALDADLIALQEVETPVKAAPQIFLQHLRALGYATLLGHTLQRGADHYGNLLLSRLPVLSQQRLDISQPGREPRGLIEARVALRQGTRSPATADLATAARDAAALARDATAAVHDAATAAGGATASAHPGLPAADTGATVLRCLATHLGLSASERRRQIAAILAQLGAAATCSRTPLVLMGDFNEWWPRNGRLAQLNRRLDAAPARASFPARWPLLALDRLWYSAGLELLEMQVVRTPATRAASDHLPLRAQLRMVAG